jgi:hypothetical protein
MFTAHTESQITLAMNASGLSRSEIVSLINDAREEGGISYEVNDHQSLNIDVDGNIEVV